MNKPVRILAADDNRDFIDDLKAYIDSQEDLELIGIAYNGTEALELIAQLSPDLVLLDMTMPNLDGLGVLEILQKEKSSPFVILLSEFGQECIIRRACRLGADYYMLKPFGLDILAKRIRQIGLGLSETEREKCNINCLEIIGQKKKNWEAELTMLLNQMGLSPRTKGFLYLRDSIVKVIQDDSISGRIKGNLYPWVAEKYQVNQKRVKDRIQYAVDIAWKGENRIFTNNYLDFEDGHRKPANLEFIMAVADKLKMCHQL